MLNPYLELGNSVPNRALRFSGFFRFRELGQSSPLAWVEISSDPSRRGPMRCSINAPALLDLVQFVPNDFGNLDLESENGDLLVRLVDRHTGEYSRSSAQFEVVGFEVKAGSLRLANSAGLQADAVLSVEGVSSASKEPGTYPSLDYWEQDPATTITWRQGGFTFHLDSSWFPFTPARQVLDRWLRPPRLSFALPALGRDAEGSSRLCTAVQEVEHPLVLLSFLFRECVSCESLAISGTSKTGEGTGRAVRHNRLWPWAKHWPREEPVFTDRASVTRALPRLADALDKHEKSALLLRAMRYLTGSYSDSGLESNYLLAFAALETAIGATTTLTDLPQDKHWRAMRREVRGCIATYASRTGIEPLVAKEIELKISELRRPSFMACALRSLQANSVEAADLWGDYGPNRVPFEVGLRRAKKVRDTLVHRTEVEDFSSMSADLSRLQCLCERLLLGALGSGHETTTHALRSLARS